MERDRHYRGRPPQTLSLVFNTPDSLSGRTPVSKVATSKQEVVSSSLTSGSKIEYLSDRFGYRQLKTTTRTIRWVFNSKEYMEITKLQKEVIFSTNKCKITLEISIDLADMANYDYQGLDGISDEMLPDILTAVGRMYKGRIKNGKIKK